MSLAFLNRSPSVSDEQQFRLMYVLTFPFFLAAVACGRAARSVAGRERPAGTPRSLVAEARVAGSNALLFAFLG